MPWSRSLNGLKESATLFECDSEAAIAAQQLQDAPQGIWEEGFDGNTIFSREAGGQTPAQRGRA